MKDMPELVDFGITPPNNIIHMFMVSTWDFGLGD